MPRWAGDKVTDRLTIRPKTKDKFLAWDIETAQTDIPEGDDLVKHVETLGIACVGTLTSDGILRTWSGSDRMTPQQCRDLAQYLWASHYVHGYTIVGFNSCSFDFRVLAEESGMLKTCEKLTLAHIDFGFHFFCEKGFMPSLQSICEGMGLPGKSGSGADAPRLWAEGKREEVLAYVSRDVEITMAVFQMIRKVKEVRWISKSGRLNEWIPSSGRLLTVKEAMQLPEPDTSWMSSPPWPREKFTGWLEE